MDQSLAFTHELPDQVLDAHLKPCHLVRCARSQERVFLSQELTEKLCAFGLTDETAKNDLLHMMLPYT